MPDLHGQVAVVTGGRSGIGAAIATRLHTDGARVAVFDLSPPDDGALPEEVNFHAADVTQPGSVDAAVAAVASEHGPISVAVANAGVPSIGTATTTTLEDWNKVLAVNLTGVWLLAAAVLPGMQQAKSGSIVTISSVSAVVGMRAVAAYTAAKAGVVGLTRQMATDYARDGIRINTICPGLTRTPMLEAQYQRVVDASSGSTTIEDRIVADLRGYPLKRLGDPTDIAAAVAYLASPDSGWVTGTVLPIDGGYTAV
jgi:NAD(P)-dependent dehydrogenase (short-subunit alcohol dehydrogenase family)